MTVRRTKFADQREMSKLASLPHLAQLRKMLFAGGTCNLTHASGYVGSFSIRVRT